MIVKMNVNETNVKAQLAANALAVPADFDKRMTAYLGFLTTTCLAMGFKTQIAIVQTFPPVVPETEQTNEVWLEVFEDDGQQNQETVTCAAMILGNLPSIVEFWQSTVYEWEAA